MASLRLLGVGSADALTHFNTNALIEQDGDRLLIDAGHTLGRALAAVGQDMNAINAVWITHCHADHIYGLERLGSQRMFQAQAKPVLYIDERLIDELWTHSLQGSMGRIGEGKRDLDDYFEVVTVSEQFRHGQVTFDLFETRHTPGKLCFGAVLNQRVMYSGDTLPLPEVVARFQPELILHDFTMHETNPVHASLSQMLHSYDADTRKRIKLMSYEDDVAQIQDAIDASHMSLAEQGFAVAL